MALITVGSNIPSLKAQRALGKSTDQLLQSSERLSSGLRINRASDDAAGLAISTHLTNQARIFNQGLRNINDGISLLNVAESGLSSLTDIVTRIKELAEQSANGTYSSTQRRSIDTEAQSLRDEFNRIINTNSFNGLKLLDGTSISLQVQAGENAVSGKELFIGSSAAAIANSGTLRAPVTYEGNGVAQVISDFNGDGFKDIAVATNTASGLLVSLGNGDGSFKAYSSYSDGLSPIYVRGGDFNRDGILDLTTVSGTVTTILIGNNNGSFKASVSYATGATTAVSVSDITNDGILDLLVTGTNFIGIVAGNGDGTFKARVSITLAATEVAETGDVNGDGNLDIMVSDDTNGYANVLLGNGNGTFKAAVSYVTGALSRAIAVDDLNNDDYLDFVVGNRTGNNATVLLGNGDGTFKTTNYSTLTDPRSVKIADINGDGIKDIVSTLNSPNRISFIFGNGDGTFSSPVSYRSNGPAESDVLDINNDNILDIIAIGGGGVGGINVLLGNSDAKLQGFTLLTRSGALSALDLADTVMSRLTLQTGSIGSQQSRLSTALSNLSQASVNNTSAASRITDVDVAEETSTYVRNQILQQSSASILAQANQMPSLVLKLLQ